MMKEKMNKRESIIFKAIRFYFTAPIPRIKNINWFPITICVVICILPILAFLKHGWTPSHKVYIVASWTITLLLLPWMLYFLMHIAFAIIESLMIAWYKIKDSYRKAEPLNQAYDDYFIARDYYESAGLIVGCKSKVNSRDQDTKNDYWAQVKNGLFKFMMQFHCLKENVAESILREYASRLVDLRRGLYSIDSIVPITKDKLNVGPCELLTVAFNLFPDPKMIGVQNMKVAQMLAAAFPGNFKVSYVTTELSRMRQDVRDEIKKHDFDRKKRSTPTEVCVLTPEQLLDSIKYFYELGE